MIRNLVAAIIICGLVIFSFFQFYHFLKQRIVASDLKAVTEKRIGAFLKVPVHVDRINIGLLKHISLSGLSINQTQKDHPILIGVKNIIVRYDLSSFLRRNFRIPTEIFLDAPRLTLQAFQASGTLFDANLLKGDRGILTRFEFEGGEVQLPWLRSDEKLRLVNMEGRATPKKGDIFDVRFKAQLSGALSGFILAYGEVDPTKKEYHLKIDLIHVAFSQDSKIPITHLNGSVELTNDAIMIRKAQFLLRGISCEVDGEIKGAFSKKPISSLFIQIQEGKWQVRSDIQANFKEESILGTLHFGPLDYRFSGSLLGDPKQFQIKNLAVNDSYKASAQFNVEDGIGQIEVERKDKTRRLQMDFSIADFDLKLIFKLDHFDLFGFDLVTYATVSLAPNEAVWQKGVHVFDVNVTTDYLIFQYQVLRDFKATARFSTEGLNDLVAHWGNVSELRGKISFGPVPRGDLTLQVGPVSLKELKSFGVHPLPHSLDGFFEGKLDAAGPLGTPNLTGAFTIEKGVVGSFEYDRAIVNFSGQLPYLLLKDSKVWKGKNSFNLKGGFDFRMSNFLEGIQVDNSEHIVIWKGLELSSELSSASSRRARSELRDVPEGVSKVEAEYKLGERTSLQVSAEESQAKKEYLTVGPKVKF